MRVFRPSSAPDLAEWLAHNREEARDGLVVTGSDPDWRGSGLDRLPRVAVSTENLSEVIELRPADLTIEVGAGVRVSEVGRIAWEEGLWLPFAADLGNRSVGGLVAEAPPSPFDETCGPVRRHVLACTIAHHDGRLTRWGRAVMKNVAGYDIPRLACGSRGRLGILSSVTLRLWPRPRQLLRIRLRGSTERVLGLSGWPRHEGIVVRRTLKSEEAEAELVFAGTDVSTARRCEQLRRRAADEGFDVEEMEAAGANGTGAAARSAGRSRDGAVYRVTFGRRYLSEGLQRIERGLGVAAGRCRIESFPSTGIVRVAVDGLEAAGRRKAPAWLTTVAEPLTGGQRASPPPAGPAVRIERGGPAEHDVSRRLRSAATRHFEDRLLAVFGGREETWQADYL